MEGASQNSVAQAVGSEQKATIHGTLVSLMILIKVKEKMEKNEKDFHGQMFEKFRVNQGLTYFFPEGLL